MNMDRNTVSRPLANSSRSWRNVECLDTDIADFVSVFDAALPAQW